VRGRGLKRNIVERAVKLSHDKYCSASAMLAHTATLTMDWAIVED
jgi:putative redox protein